jgi:hypothetical protein
MVQLEGLGQLKNPITSSGTEPATFQYDHCVTSNSMMNLIITSPLTYSTFPDDDISG